MPPKTTTPATTTFTSTSKPMTTKTTNRSFTVHCAYEQAEELRASQLANVASEELEWFFTSTDTDGAAVQARAVIEGWIGALDPAEQRALALRFDPEPWSDAMRAAGLESGYVLALSLTTTAPWHSHSRPHQGPHRRASEHMELAVQTRGISVLRGISRRADWDYATAVRAYATSRGRCASVLPRRAA
jgi:hypothetical protein